MTAVAASHTTADSPSPPARNQKFTRTAAFALAGIALFGIVLDEYDVPHDNPQGFIVLGSGALAGLLVALCVPAALRERATRIAWDSVRLVLAYEMIRYGFPKLIGMQFYPQYSRIDMRTVDMSPMALAWAFLGRTYWYQAFGGLIEVASGILVCFRRTTLIGACLMTTALFNVALINYFYGVPVKLFATVYLLFDLALIAREWRRLWTFFLTPVERLDRGTWGRRVYGLAIVLTILVPTVRKLREGIDHRVFERELLEGAWSVDERSGAADPAWDRVYFEKDDVGFIRVGNRRIPFQKQLDGSQLRLSITANDRSYVARGTFVLEGRTLRFDGTCDAEPCAMTLNREFPL